MQHLLLVDTGRNALWEFATHQRQAEPTFFKIYNVYFSNLRFVFLFFSFYAGPDLTPKITDTTSVV